MKRITTLGLALVLWLGATAAATAAGPPTAPDTVTGTRAFLLGTCPVSSTLKLKAPLSPGEVLAAGGSWQENPLAAVAAVGGVLVEPLVDLAGEAMAEWLEERAREQSATSTAVATGALLHGPDRHLPCVVLVEGDFDTSEAARLVAPGALGSGPAPSAWDWPEPWLALFRLRDKPRLYMELRLDPFAGYEAIRLVPEFIDLRATAAKRGEGKPVHLALTAGLSLRGSSIGTTVLPLPTPVRPPVRLTPAQLTAAGGPWIALPQPVSPPSPGAGSGGDEIRVVNGPLSIQLAFVESVKPSKAEQLLARTFGAVRKPVAEAVTGWGRSALTEGRMAPPPVETERQ